VADTPAPPPLRSLLTVCTCILGILIVASLSLARTVLIPLALAILPVALALTLADGHHLLHLDVRHVVAYLAWALLQQWAMLALVMGRLERTGLPRPAILLVTATLFGLLHTPNGALMQLCLAAELWWAWSFMRSPRLLPIALAHAASALLVESGLTGHLLRSLEVSARFFQ